MVQNRFLATRLYSEGSYFSLYHALAIPHVAGAYSLFYLLVSLIVQSLAIRQHIHISFILQRFE